MIRADILRGSITVEDLLNSVTVTAKDSNIQDFGSKFFCSPAAQHKDCLQKFPSLTSQPVDACSSCHNVVENGNIDTSSTKVSIPTTEAIHEFLTFIYDEIEALIKQSTTQPNSCTSTPVSHSISTSDCTKPGSMGLTASEDISPISLLPPTSASSSKAASNGLSEGSGSAQQKRKPCRVQLFSCTTPERSTSIQNVIDTGWRKNSPGLSSIEAVGPLSTSSPVLHHSNRRNGLTLADFVTPDRKQRNRKQCRKSLTSPPSGLDDSGKTSLSPLNPPPKHADTKSSADVKPTRRITPTIVSDMSQRKEFTQQAVFVPDSPRKSKVVPGSFAAEWRSLREKKAQLMVPIQELITPCKSKSSCGLNDKPITTITPQPELVTRRQEVITAAGVFSALITAGKTRDVTSDLHLLIQLVCCQVSNTVHPATSSEESSLLNTIHNGVLFSVQTLYTCQLLHSLLDSSLCKLLAENDRVVVFNPVLAARLSELSERLKNPNLNHSTFSSVSFQAETDDTKNFPSNRSFLAFKKQRDLFYEIKRLWDEEHLMAGWNFKMTCSSMITQLLNAPGADLANHIHLCRLFVNQLLVSCLSGSDVHWSDEDDESISLLNQLKLTQPDKYKKLRDRFILPNTSTQLTKLAAFSDAELFFKNFIDVAKDAIFIQHLKDALTMKLLLLNQQEFSPTESDTSDSQELYSEYVPMSRLIAKFLSYLHFFCYQCSEKITPALDEQYSLLRLTGTDSTLDVQQYLQEGNRLGRLCFVIPWITQYLSQLDTYSLTLPAYQSVLQILYGHLEKLKATISRPTRIHSLLVQYVCLQWLFSLAKFDELELSTHCNSTTLASGTDGCLDSSDVVTVDVIYGCSAILQACKRCLIDYVMGSKSKLVFTRKITPLSTIATPPIQSSQSTFGATLQQRLEDNFFQNQPASLKKTVNFIAERIASSYIKEFRSGILVKVLTEQRVKARATGYELAHSTNHNLELVKVRLASTMEHVATNVVAELHGQALSGVANYFKQRVNDIFLHLLPCDTEEHIIRISSTLTLRQGRERVRKWLVSHLTTEFICLELKQEAIRYVRSSFTTPSPDRAPTQMYVNLGCKYHNPDAPSPFDVMCKLQSAFDKLSSDMAAKDMQEDLLIVLELCSSCLTERCDVLPSALKTILYMTVSLLLLYANASSKPFSPELIERCQFLWTGEKISTHTNTLVELVPTSKLYYTSECTNFHYKFMSFLASRSII